jgi:hypothetical protein
MSAAACVWTSVKRAMRGAVVSGAAELKVGYVRERQVSRSIAAGRFHPPDPAAAMCIRTASGAVYEAGQDNGGDSA